MSLPSEKDLWFLPLGGCGEIGMNLNLIGHDHQWLMIDCGITFNSDLSPTRVELPDPQFVLSIKDALCGIVLTHAHEDHFHGTDAHVLATRIRRPVDQYAVPTLGQREELRLTNPLHTRLHRCPRTK